MNQTKCSFCAISELFSKKWLHQILKILTVSEVGRYSNLKDRLKGISSKTLSARLRELEEEGIVNRTVIPKRPPRVEYSLTQKGKELSSAIDCTCEWVFKWYSNEHTHNQML
jgi:DNA-binding HxlR family transcriptional regulator